MPDESEASIPEKDEAESVFQKDSDHQQTNELNSSPFITTSHSNGLNINGLSMLSNLDDDQGNNNNDKPLYEISVKIDSKISVYATLAFVKKFFQRKSVYFQSKLRAWGKSRSKEIPQTHIYYLLDFNYFNDGTRALFFHKPIFYCSLIDFSSIFLFCNKDSKSWTAIHR